jgi:voltage-gated potassium channel
MNIRKRIYQILFSISLVVLAGSIGYYILFGGKEKLIDCVYMAVISLTTVGFGEVIQVTGNVPAQIFTMLLITFGMGIILYGISTVTALIIEGELSGILRKKKMFKRISKMKNHYIVCGGGETGRQVIEELAKNQEPFVLVEQNEDNIERCKSVTDLLYVEGDATDDENLVTAGIEKAAGIIITLPSDKDTLYVTMAARMLNKEIRIICRMVDQKLLPKLKMAGANSIVSPNTIGALRMASEMIRPAAVDFLDRMLRSKKGNLRIHQVVVQENSAIAGKNLQESGLKAKFDLLILAVRHDDGEIEFNPIPSQVLNAGTTLIIMGDVDNIARARKSI